MKALIVLSDPALVRVAEESLRKQGCTEFVYKAEDAEGIYHYAVIQVFDSEEERMSYTVDESHPLMVDLKTFVERHPHCYVLAVTHFPCENDGRTAFEQGADWWIIETSLSLASNWDHARASHVMKKGTPSWEMEADTATVREPAA